MGPLTDVGLRSSACESAGYMRRGLLRILPNKGGQTAMLLEKNTVAHLGLFEAPR